MSTYIMLIQIFICIILFPLPHFLNYCIKGKYYTPFSAEDNISSLIYDETSLYAPQVKKLMRNGNIFMEDVYEYSNFRTNHPLFPNIFISFLSYLLGDLEYAWVFLDILFPTLFWLWGYLIIGFFSKNIIFRSFVAWLLVLFPLGPRNFLFLGFESLLQPIEITRQTMPGFGLPFLLFCSLFFVKVIEKKKKWLSLFCGVTSGLLFHIYYFYWVAFFGGVFTLLILFIVKKKKDYIIHLLLVLITALLIGMPIFIIGFIDREILTWVFVRFSMPSRELSIEGLIYFIIFIIGVFFIINDKNFPTKNRIIVLSLLSLMLGAAIGMNLQLLTGIDMFHAHHFRNRVLQPLFVIMFFIFIAHFFGKRVDKKICMVFQFLLLLIILSMGFYRQIQVFVRTSPYHDKRLPHVDILTYASKIVPNNDVIGSVDRKIVILNSVITGNYSFVPIGPRTKVSNEEILKRYFLLCYLTGLSLKEAKMIYGHVSEKPSEPWLRIWIHYPYLLILSLIDYLPPQLSQWVDMLWAKGPRFEDIENRKLDYLIIPVNQKHRLNKFYSNIKKVYQNSVWQLIYVSRK